MTNSLLKSALIGAVVAASLSAGPALAVNPLSASQIDMVLNNNCVRERGRAEDAAGRLGLSRMTYTNWARSFLGSSIDDAAIGRMLDQLESTVQGASSDQRTIAEFQYCVILNKDRYG